jgi:hypothetical protein
VERAEAPAIPSSLSLYKEVRDLGFKTFLLTGRSEGHEGVTVDNLRKEGFHEWDKLILRYCFAILKPLPLHIAFSEVPQKCHCTLCRQFLHDNGILKHAFAMSRAAADRKKTATAYKSEKRKEMEAEGYRILGNSGDQWSDLLGYSMSARSFKLPNPMYYIP